MQDILLDKANFHLVLLGTQWSVVFSYLNSKETKVFFELKDASRKFQIMWREVVNDIFTKFRKTFDRIFDVHEN